MNYAKVDILLVEDNPTDVELTLRAFEKNTFSKNIFVVNDGEEALDFIYCKNKYCERSEAHLPKLILLDLKLPKIDGLEVLRTLKNDHEKKIIPIVVLTSSRRDVDIISSYQLGVNSYFQKPLNFNDFIQAINVIGIYWLTINQLPEFY